MASRVYFQTALKWALAMMLIPASLVGGHEIWIYFAYSIEKGVMEIHEYSESSFCDSTEWGVGTPCCNPMKLSVTEDLFWYPLFYDPWDRTQEFGLDEKVKDWKLQRKWGDGWRTIPLDRPCTGTWCGGKFWGALYSIAWRTGKIYDVQVCAIKYNATDYINWGFGIFNTTWLGKKMTWYEDRYLVEPDGKEIIYIPGFNCTNNNPFVECDSCMDGNCNGKIDSGESFTKIDVRDWSTKIRTDTGKGVVTIS